MTTIKFTSDSKVNEYSNGNLHIINDGNPVEISEILASDLLEEKINGVNIFERVLEEAVDDTADNSGIVTTAPSEENRSGVTTDVGILEDPPASADNADNANPSGDSDKTEDSKADESVFKTSSRRNRQ